MPDQITLSYFIIWRVWKEPAVLCSLYCNNTCAILAMLALPCVHTWDCMCVRACVNECVYTLAWNIQCCSVSCSYCSCHCISLSSYLFVFFFSLPSLFCFSLFFFFLSLFIAGVARSCPKCPAHLCDITAGSVQSDQLLVKGVNETLVAQRVVPALITLSSDPEM